jgi:diguanylate cyclase (GGDEF)-like protein
LVQALALARRRRRRAVLLYIDLDGFKDINDRFGHRAGDELLRCVAGRLARRLRRSDTVARLGGDEFLVLLPDCGPLHGGEDIARKLLAAIRRPCRVRRRDLQVSASIGLAVYPEDGRSAAVLLRHADHAMYEAKAAGRNAWRGWRPGRKARKVKSERVKAGRGPRA